MRLSTLLLAATLPTLFLTAAGIARAVEAGDPAQGKKVFAKCQACHSLEAGKNKVGPTLHGVMGRASASEAEFNYSDAMKNAHLTWDPETLGQVPCQSEGSGARHQDGVPRPAQGEGPGGRHLLSGAGRRVIAVSEGRSARIVGVLAAGLAALTFAFGQAALAQSTPLHVPIVYLKETIDEPLPLSLVEPVATDNGLAGVKLAIGDNNTTGKFLKQEFELVEKTIPAGGDLKAAAAELAGAGQKLVVADLTAPRLTELADLPEMKDAVIFNIRAEDDALRAGRLPRQRLPHDPQPRHEGRCAGAVAGQQEMDALGPGLRRQRVRPGLRRRGPAHRQALPRRDRRRARLRVQGRIAPHRHRRAAGARADDAADAAPAGP